MDRFWCRECGAIVDHVIEKRWRSSEYGDETVIYCPQCNSENCVEELEPCPSCDRGWKLKSDRICEKCQLRVKSYFGRFLRDLSKPEREFLDDILDGTSVEEFV